MNPLTRILTDPRMLPFADAASDNLPLSRLMRLALFQVSVGMALALLAGTLNRIMIVELHVPAWLVGSMLALPLLFAPFRAFLGHRSDHYRSILGWKRVPYIWFGTLLQFGGLAIMPFALLVLSGTGRGPVIYGQIGAALAFLLVGAGLHTTQTAGLALATDIAPKETRPRVVALLYVMLLIGMVGASVAFGWLLADYTHLRLVQVIQGAAFLTFVFNVIALWRQEPRDPLRGKETAVAPPFREVWQRFTAPASTRRLLWTIGLGTAAFSMQDVLLEPYGGEILGMPIGATSLLTAFWATGALLAFGLAARRLRVGADPLRVAASGLLTGLIAFAAVVLSDPLGSPHPIQSRCTADRLWRWFVLGRDAAGRHGPGAQRQWPRVGSVGCRASNGCRCVDRGRRRLVRFRWPLRRSRRAWPRANLKGLGLHVRVPP